jgi:hypothetical protein
MPRCRLVVCTTTVCQLLPVPGLLPVPRLLPVPGLPPLPSGLCRAVERSLKRSCLVRTFSTASRAPSAPAAGRPGSATGSADCGHPARRTGAASAVAGQGRWHSAVTGRQRCRALSGGSPAGAAAAAGPLASHPPRPVPRHRAGGRACKSGTAVPLAPGILSPSKDHSQGARLRRGASHWRKRHPLSSDLPRRTSAPIKGTAECRGCLDT